MKDGWLESIEHVFAVWASSLKANPTPGYPVYNFPPLLTYVDLCGGYTDPPGADKSDTVQIYTSEATFQLQPLLATIFPRITIGQLVVAIRDLAHLAQPCLCSFKAVLKLEDLNLVVDFD
jgi:hypothetical protein